MTSQPDVIGRKLRDLRKSIHVMHKAVAVERDRQTQRNEKGQRDQKHQDKLLVTWIGPYQIVKADVHSFVVLHLATGAESDVHASRLKCYADKDFEVTEEVVEHVASQGIVLAVAELKEHRWCAVKKDYELLVSWKGLKIHGNRCNHSGRTYQ
ncbi:hypothetical protein F441_23043 [Phytophthora nicotianae CJ01A1]|uniref:Chromo domain-containing protein n=2 Tax=Phytophthora nicotianae TaxID=4792 RepID=W2VMX9_PHYNI|nr:hypothetical protein F444_18605 [Phytophthora nicotianae P1976]ETO99540.1 hypothetical protein F441_23043 [Phytophthora nicotianae CJ01A1]